MGITTNYGKLASLAPKKKPHARRRKNKIKPPHPVYREHAKTGLAVATPIPLTDLVGVRYYLKSVPRNKVRQALAAGARWSGSFWYLDNPPFPISDYTAWNPIRAVAPYNGPGQQHSALIRHMKRSSSTQGIMPRKT
jgi:hypothetical protein